MGIVRFFVLWCAVAGMVAVAADEGIVFEGFPEVRIDSDGHTTQKADMSRSAVCRIAKHGRRYVWASREGRRLDRVDAGDFVYYISPEGSGYVKVRKNKAGKGEYDYMEHLASGFTTVTYWGRSSGDH